MDNKKELIKEAKRLFIKTKQDKQGITIALIEEKGIGIEIEINNRINREDVKNALFLSEKYNLPEFSVDADDCKIVIQMLRLSA